MNWFVNIWSYHRWLIKLVLFIFFWLIVGFPQAFVKSWQEDNLKNKLSAEEQASADREIFAFTRDLLIEREKRIAEGIPYGPFDYFEDLKAQDIRCRELKIKSGGSADLRRLHYIMRKNVEDGKFTQKDLEKAIDGYRAFVDPMNESRKELRKSLDENGWMPVFIWLFWLYLKVMPLAFILYLVWIQDEQGYGAFKMPKPLSFIRLILIYPVIVGGRWWSLLNTTDRRIRAEMEVRRIDLFAYLSDEELEKIRQFAKSNLSISEWRRELDELGLKPKHSLGAALAVTLLFICFIRPAEASAKKIKSFAESSLVLSQIELTKNLARSQIESAKSEKIETEKEKNEFELLPLEFFLILQKGLQNGKSAADFEIIR